jgi:hypothetical protein
MTDKSTQKNQDPTKSNPNAVSIRIEPKAMAKAKFQRRHDYRIGSQPNYVDGDRTHLNRDLIDLRPLPEIQRENAAKRLVAGRTRKMKSNAAVITAGIITFGHIAQDVFNSLPIETQDQAFTELAYEIANRLDTTLEALVVHLDETAIHAHFMLRAYNNVGQPISDATRLGDMSALQDLAAEVMQRYAPDIERGQKKKARLEAGANYADTLHRTVKELHNDLPQEKAMLEADIDALSQDIIEKEQSAQKTQAHLNQLKTKAELAEKERKREETYIVTRQASIEKDQRRIADLEIRKDLNAKEEKRLGVYRARLVKKITVLKDIQTQQQEQNEDLQRREALLAEAESRNAVATQELDEKIIETERNAAQASAAINEAEISKATYETAITAVEVIADEMVSGTIRATPNGIIIENPNPIMAAPKPVRQRLTKLVHQYLDMQKAWDKRTTWINEMVGKIQWWLGRDDLTEDARNDGNEIVEDYGKGPDI